MLTHEIYYKNCYVCSVQDILDNIMIFLSRFGLSSLLF